MLSSSDQFCYDGIYVGTGNIVCMSILWVSPQTTLCWRRIGKNIVSQLWRLVAVELSKAPTQCWMRVYFTKTMTILCKDGELYQVQPPYHQKLFGLQSLSKHLLNDRSLFGSFIVDYSYLFAWCRSSKFTIVFMKFRPCHGKLPLKMHWRICLSLGESKLLRKHLHAPLSQAAAVARLFFSVGAQKLFWKVLIRTFHTIE